MVYTCVRHAVEDALGTMQGFIDATIVFIVSYQWFDLISIYLLQFNNRPFCKALETSNGSTPRGCGDVTEWWKQMLVALAFWIGSPLVLMAASRAEKRWKWTSLSIVPSMVGMFIGWLTGASSNATIAYANQNKKGSGFRASFTAIDLLFALAWTLVTAGLLLRLQSWHPLAQAKLAAARKDGTGQKVSLRDLAIEYSTELCSIALRSLKYNLMGIWAFTVSRILTGGISQECPNLMARALLFFALTLTFMGSLLTVQLLAWRTWLLKFDRKDMDDLRHISPETYHEIMTPIQEDEDETAVHSSRQDPKARKGGEDAHANGDASHNDLIEGDAPQRDAKPMLQRSKTLNNVLAKLGEVEWRIVRRKATTQFLVLIEGVLAWVAGVAWIDWVTAASTQGLPPGAKVLTIDILIAFLVSLLSLLWFIGTGQRTDIDDESKAMRENVEKFFITNALAFVVGWAWVVVMRDIVYVATKNVSEDTDLLS